MKHIEIKDLLKKELLVLELSEGTELTAIGNDKQVYYAVKHNGMEKFTKVADGKAWKLLGKADEIREEDARELVNLHESGYYKDYINGNNFFTLPSKSLLSAIESEIYW